MNLAAIFFVLATTLTIRMPISVSDELVRMLVLLVPIAIIALCKPASRIFGAFYFGVLYVLLSAQQLLVHSLPTQLEQLDMVIEGYIISLPVHTPAKVTDAQADVAIFSRGHSKFQFQVQKTDTGWTGGIVQLSLYDDRVVKAGQKLRLKVRLNRPRGLVNSGLFDYEAWLFSRRVVATGYVRKFEVLPGGQFENISTWHHQLRQFLSGRIGNLAGDNPYTPLLLALSTGESQQIPAAMWDVLSGTGTNHLLIISGLHVGLIAALSLKVLNALLRGLPNHRLIAGGFSGLFTLAYGAIAGFGLPVQRALMMVLIVYVALLLKRASSVLRLCCFALLGVALVDPFASISMGFWLSFGAVFLLLYVFSLPRFESVPGSAPVPVMSPTPGLSEEMLRKTAHWCGRMLYSQWVVFAGMCPLMLICVAQFSLVGFLANLIAIPFVSLLVVPLVFISLPLVVLSDILGGWAIEMLLTLLSWLWIYLVSLNNLDLRLYSATIPTVVGLLSVVGIIYVFSPRGLVPRWLSILLLLPLLKVQMPERVRQGEISLTLLDVGQGLSVIVTGANHTVIYDTGPRYGDRFDTGQQIVTAFLRGKGVSKIDKLIVSHNDNDHAGGARAINRNFSVAEVLRGEPVDSGDIACDKRLNWRLDGVTYSIVEQVDGRLAKSKNDRSCVLLIQTNHYTLLLPGDISFDAEQYLALEPDLKVDLLVSPHHGSATSSSPGFLNRINSDIVLISAGYKNKFGHPHKDVVSRYRAREMKILNTAQTGAITISTGQGPLVSFARAQPAGLWRPGLKSTGWPKLAARVFSQ